MKKLILIFLLPISVVGQYTIQNNTSSVTILPSSIQTTKFNDNDGTSVAIGKNALKNNYQDTYKGLSNVAVGNNSLSKNGIGTTQAFESCFNTAIGSGALENNTKGSGNVAIGQLALSSNIDGAFNIAIGNSAGQGINDNNKLYISSFGTSTPLIWGDFASKLLGFHGKVGVQTKTPIDLLNIHDDNPTPQSYARFTSGLTGQTTTDGLKIGISAANEGIFFNYENKPIHFGTNALNRMTIHENGNVGIGTVIPDTKLEVNGYTKLGTDAPKIKLKKIVTNTGANQGDITNIAHGLTSTKIIAVNVLVDYGTGEYISHHYTIAGGYEFHFVVNTSSIEIKTKNGNSVNILNKPVKILITYEE